jgi:2-polyprenyl-3-methyl-5-hydroxy-6-metoxy-1,4-benzoquinol methylase
MTTDRPVPAPYGSIADFDARAATWDDDPAKVLRAQAIADAIARDVALTPTMEALEYGSGTGMLGFMLRPRFADVTLADLSDGMLAVASTKIAAAGDTHMRAIKLDLLADPPPERRFDVVFSAMTLHHIPDTQAILRCFHSVLRKPGFLCIADLDSEDGSFHGEGFDGHLGFDRDKLGAMARKAGFDSVRFTTAYEMEKEAAGGTRTFPIFLMVATTT